MVFEKKMLKKRKIETDSDIKTIFNTRNFEKIKILINEKKITIDQIVPGFEITYLDYVKRMRSPDLLAQLLDLGENINEKFIFNMLEDRPNLSLVKSVLIFFEKNRFINKKNIELIYESLIKSCSENSYECVVFLFDKYKMRNLVALLHFLVDYNNHDIINWILNEDSYWLDNSEWLFKILEKCIKTKKFYGIKKMIELLEKSGVKDFNPIIRTLMNQSDNYDKELMIDIIERDKRRTKIVGSNGILSDEESFTIALKKKDFFIIKSYIKSKHKQLLQVDDKSTILNIVYEIYNDEFIEKKLKKTFPDFKNSLSSNNFYLKIISDLRKRYINNHLNEIQ